MKKLLFALLCIFSYSLFSQDTVKVASMLTPDQQAELDYNSGLEKLKNNDYTSAIDFFTKSIVNKPTFDKALINRAVALTQAKRYVEACADINSVIKLTPQNAEAYFTKSLIFFNEGKKDSQLVALDKCIGINSNHAEASYYKGLLMYENGEYKLAVESYNKAIMAKADTLMRITTGQVLNAL